MYAFGKLMQTKRQVRKRVSVGLRVICKTNTIDTRKLKDWRQICIFSEDKSLSFAWLRTASGFPAYHLFSYNLYRRGIGAGSARSPRALSHFFSPKISISSNPRSEPVCAPFPCGAHLKFTQFSDLHNVPLPVRSSRSSCRRLRGRWFRMHGHR